MVSVCAPTVVSSSQRARERPSLFVAMSSGTITSRAPSAGVHVTGAPAIGRCPPSRSSTTMCCGSSVCASALCTSPEAIESVGGAGSATLSLHAQASTIAAAAATRDIRRVINTR